VIQKYMVPLNLRINSPRLAGHSMKLMVGKRGWGDMQDSQPYRSFQFLEFSLSGRRRPGFGRCHESITCIFIFSGPFAYPCTGEVYFGKTGDEKRWGRPGNGPKSGWRSFRGPRGYGVLSPGLPLAPVKSLTKIGSGLPAPGRGASGSKKLWETGPECFPQQKYTENLAPHLKPKGLGNGILPKKS